MVTAVVPVAGRLVNAEEVIRVALPLAEAALLTPGEEVGREKRTNEIFMFANEPRFRSQIEGKKVISDNARPDKKTKREPTAVGKYGE